VQPPGLIFLLFFFRPRSVAVLRSVVVPRSVEFRSSANPSGRVSATASNSLGCLSLGPRCGADAGAAAGAEAAAFTSSSDSSTIRQPLSDAGASAAGAAATPLRSVPPLVR